LARQTIFWVKNIPNKIYWVTPYRGPFSKKEAFEWIEHHRNPDASTKEWIKDAKRIGIVGMKIRKLKNNKYQIYFGFKEKIF
jgi:hypothetical protein